MSIDFETEEPLIRASRRSAFCDVFRIPYAVGAAAPPGLHALHGAAGSLLWPVPEQLAGGTPRLHRLGEVGIFARSLSDEEIAPLLDSGAGWEPAEPLALDGAATRSIWRSAEGSVLLPFDPDEAIRSLWREAYVREATSSRLRHLAMRGYYWVKPALPRSAQIAARRAFSRVQARTPFPRWPVETSLHDLYDILLETLARLAGEPLPTIAPWPHGHRWALVLTHDVETATGRDAIDPLRALEQAAGFRSSWNFVPRRYDVPDELVHDLQEDGFEVGVHGLYHDGRDLESLETLEARLPEMRAAAERWSAVGFRSPATHRRWEWMPRLGFDYDSSYPDTDPYEPQAGGCCSWFPFFNDGLIELPLTLPQDHTLFVILQHKDERIWIDKTEAIRSRGGMALMNAHPDYLLSAERRACYERFLGAFADDPSLWKALPADVSSWWRRRAASRLVRHSDTWQIHGSACGEATVCLIDPGEVRHVENLDVRLAETCA